jgi:myosin heavy subunit
MAKLISSKDIFEDEDVFRGIRDSANKTIADLTNLETQMKKTASEIKTSLGGQKLDSTQSLKDFTQATEQATKMTKEMVKIEQEKAKLLAISEKAEREVIRTQQLREKEAQKTAKAIQNETSAYKQLEKATREAKNEAREMASQLLALEKAGKQNTDEFKKLSNQYSDSAKRAAEMDKELKAIDESVGDNFRKVGSYKQELRKLMEEMMRMDQSSEAFKVAQKRAADLKDEITDLAQETKANAGNAFEQLSNNTQLFGSRLLDLDLAGAGKALTGMAGAVKGIDFKLLGQETKALATGFYDLGKAILTNPLFLLGGVIIAIAMNYKELVAWMTDASGEMARQTQLRKDLNAEIEKELGNTADEITKIEVLTNRVNDHNLSEKERRESLDLLSKLYPDYFSNLNGDINDTNKLTAAKTKLVNKMISEAKARAAQNLLSDAYAKKMALEMQVNEAKATMGADKVNEALNDARDNNQTLFKETNQAISDWWNGTEGVGKAALELEKTLSNIADLEKMASSSVVMAAEEDVKALEKVQKVKKEQKKKEKVDREKFFQDYMKEQEENSYVEVNEALKRNKDQADAEKKSQDERAEAEKENARKLKEWKINNVTDAELARMEAEKKELERIEKEKKAIIEQSVKLSTDFFVSQSQKKVQAMENELTEAEKQAESLQRLAESGNISAQQSLAEQQKLIAEKEKERMKEVKRQQKIQLAQSVFSSYTANVENDPNTAVAKTIQDATVLTQFINSLPAFEKGTEDTGANGRGVDGKGGFLSVLHPNERVVPKSLNDKIGAMTNEQLAQIAMSYQNGKLVKGDSAGSSLDLALLVNKLDEVNTTIRNKPETSIELGEITQTIMEVVKTTKKGNTVTYNRFKTRK